MRRAASATAALALVAACGGKSGSLARAGRDAGAAEQSYREGVRELESKSFPEAQKIFEQVKTKYPYSKYAALSELRLADLRFRQDKYVEAADLYRQFVKLHPSHEEVDYAAFRVGLSRYRDMPTDFFLFPPAYEREMGSAEQGLAALEEFLAKYPRSKHADEARKLLGELKGRFADREWYVAQFYRKRDRWPGVAGRLERLVRLYPGSAREPEALYGLAEAYLKMNERFRAQQALQQLIVRHPKDPRRAEAEKLLASVR